jgi:hypothetical protein
MAVAPQTSIGMAPNLGGNTVSLENLIFCLQQERAGQIDRQIQQMAEKINSRRQEIKHRLMTDGMSSQGADAILQGGGKLSQADAIAAKRALSTQQVPVSSGSELVMLNLQSMMAKRSQILQVMSNILKKVQSTNTSIIQNIR